MRKKTAFFIILLLCTTLFSSAQFYKTIRPDNSFSDSLSRIVYDFKKNFYPIQGKQLTSQVMADVYQSNVGVPGAIHCVIQRYHSEEDTTASFQAIMFEGELYEDAAEVYKNTIKQLKKVKLKFGESNHGAFIGEIEVPDESLNFTVTHLRLSIADKDYKYFYAEVEITNNYNGWEVHLNLHNKKSDREQY